MQIRTKPIILVILLCLAITAVKAQDEILSNQAIIELTDAGLSKALIIQKIGISKTRFDLSTAALIALKRGNVADDVIAAMMNARPSAEARSGSLPPVPVPPTVPPVAPRRVATEPATTVVDEPDVPDIAQQGGDPVCLTAELDPANTSANTTYLCALVEHVINQPTPRISIRGAHGTLMELFVTQVVAKNRLFENDADKMSAAKEIFLEADKRRTDKQIGGGPGSSGTTSLAVKGGGPSIIGWAVEHGGATSSVDGNTVTVRINPFGLARALQGEGFLGSNFLRTLTNRTSGTGAASDQAFNNKLRKFSTSVSFDMTRGQETPVFIVSKQQISAFSLRYEFINQRNPHSARAQRLFHQYVADSTADKQGMIRVAGQLVDLSAPVARYKNAALQKWVVDTNAELAALPKPLKEGLEEIGDRIDLTPEKIEELKNRFDLSNERVKELLDLVVGNNAKMQQVVALLSPVAQRNYEESVRQVLERRLAVLPVDAIVNDPIVKPAFESLASISMSFAERRRNFLQELNKGSIATFEYTNHREPIAPDTSNFRFIWENGRFFRNTDFTFNASLTIYNKKPLFTNVKRFRDFQFAVQTDTSVGNVFGTGDAILTFAGKYERLNGDTIDAFGVVHPDTEGDTAIGQFKFTIPIADWGIKLPLSVTFANRTDLIRESRVRANFGFTFDLDPLFARFKPF